MRRRPTASVVPRALREADASMKRIADVARLLPALTATNAAEERARLVRALEGGEAPAPSWRLERRRVDPALWRLLDGARRAVLGTPVEELYLERLEELELELSMIDALGEPKLVRPLAARRFGTGRTEVELPDGPVPLARVARALLDSLPHREEPREVPPCAEPDRPSLASLMLTVARRAGLRIEIKVEPRLSAGAATGDRTIFLADRRFGRRESVRFAVHEVLGHAVAAANARDQPIRLFEIGTAGSFSVQEGMCLCLEEVAGVLDAYRLRIVAARVLATDRMHQGAPFGDTARWLHAELGFSAPDAIAVAERAYRGGGVARDVGYLRGWLRVRTSIAAGETSIDFLRIGRVGLDAARALPRLLEAGLARPPRYRPSLSRSLAATPAGTSLETSPPSVAASFTMLEET
ncbi:MAG TPA: DUF1704 domain-containing protein [Sandaracinaceae bacterium LLY-WYZ-13_1]|nr:DUF1704 domain-containing protein [Sandaracinaceae bacterium LLY-WYZ-13_1]